VVQLLERPPVGQHQPSAQQLRQNLQQRQSEPVFARRQPGEWAIHRWVRPHRFRFQRLENVQREKIRPAHLEGLLGWSWLNLVWCSDLPRAHLLPRLAWL